MFPHSTYEKERNVIFRHSSFQKYSVISMLLNYNSLVNYQNSKYEEWVPVDILIYVELLKNIYYLNLIAHSINIV